VEVTKRLTPSVLEGRLGDLTSTQAITQVGAGKMGKE
jgi:hypothetical protein